MIVRAKTFTDWMTANFTKGEMQDIARHGANCGYHGLTYYTDTVKLYDKFCDDIWEALYQDAESLGYNILQLIATFGGAKDVGSDEQLKNLLVWYLAERIAREQTEQD